MKVERVYLIEVVCFCYDAAYVRHENTTVEEFDVVEEAPLSVAE